MKSFYKSVIVLVLVVLAFCITGCGKNKDTKELDAYYDSMSRFASGMTKIKNDLESVDTSVPGAYKEVLSYLDKMQEQIETLAEMEVPDEFSSNEELADEANEYMHQAVSLFHQYYEDPDCERAVFEAASENYSRAMKRVNYISYILRGELPEGEDYEVIKNDTDFKPVTDESSENGNDMGVDDTFGEDIVDDSVISDEVLE